LHRIDPARELRSRSDSRAPADVVAAAVQQARIALHPNYFNHNALYHLLQAIALFPDLSRGDLPGAAP